MKTAKSNKTIYMDYASSTPVNPEVLEAMMPYFSEKFGNERSRHGKGYEAKRAIDDSRKLAAETIKCRPDEIIFTSGGTESNNLAIRGATQASKKTHLITSKIEHSSVLGVFQSLEKEGFNVTYLATDKEGLISTELLKKAITDKTALVSIMHANNEIGTIEPIKELAEMAHKHGALFHTDACQSLGSVAINLQDWKVDLLTLNGGKIYGPKGIGLLYLKRETEISPIFHGGGQEQGLRSGTLNTPLIVGLAQAMRLCEKNRVREAPRLLTLRDKLITGLLKNIPGTFLNGPPQTSIHRLSNNANICIPGTEGDNLILRLDAAGIECGNGAACSANSSNPSHVLTAIGLSEKDAKSSIRLSLGNQNTEEDVDYVIEQILKITLIV